MVVKVDLSKAYDRVSWFNLRLILIHLGFCTQFVSWVMNCITLVSFAILINGADTSFFRPERELRQVCALSPLLFLLVEEGLSGSFKEAIGNGSFTEINVANTVSHLLFVDDNLILCEL